LVAASGQALRTVKYNGTLYYTGYYASRPELKVLHYSTTRWLLAAEAFGLLTSGPFASITRPFALDPLFWDCVAQAWSDFVPSIHRDYVCGTATDFVTATEQLPLLRIAHVEAYQSADAALSALAASIPAAPGAVVVANPTGVAFSGLVELPGPVPPDVHSATFDGQNVPCSRAWKVGSCSR
jgi:alpha-mannosidase